jgi:hypothetical protein
VEKTHVSRGKVMKTYALVAILTYALFASTAGSGMARETPSTCGYYDTDVSRFRYLPVWVNRLRWCYWLFGRRSEVTRVTEFTWKHEYLAFRKWLTTNETYLRFHEKELQFKVDQDAKKQGRTVPEVERIIPIRTTPFPDWEGTTPEAYDHDFAGLSSAKKRGRE